MVPDDLVISVVEDGGVAVVEFDDEAFGEVANSDQDALIAQLVFTLGQRPGVGQVQFMRGGEPFLVRVPSRGNILSDDPVAADDFEALLTDAVNPPPTPSRHRLDGRRRHAGHYAAGDARPTPRHPPHDRGPRSPTGAGRDAEPRRGA